MVLWGQARFGSGLLRSQEARRRPGRKEGREEPIRLQQANEESQPPMDTNEHEFINQLSIDSPATAKFGKDWC